MSLLRSEVYQKWQSWHIQQFITKLRIQKIDLLRENHLELFFDYVNAPITKEDFVRPIWCLGAKLFDGDIVHTS